MRFVVDVCQRPGPETADHVRDRRREATSPRRTLDHLSRLRRRAARCGSATAPTTSARTTSGAPCSTRSTSTEDPRGHRPSELAPIVCEQVEAASTAWHQPDQGIWEARGEPKHYVSSKLMIWVAVDRGARLAARLGDERARRGVGSARPTRSRPRSSSAASRRRLPPALRDRRARRLAAADPAGPLPARRTTSACAPRSRRSPTS